MDDNNNFLFVILILQLLCLIVSTGILIYYISDFFWGVIKCLVF